MGVESGSLFDLEQARGMIYTVLWRMAKIPPGNNAKRVRIYHTIVVSSLDDLPSHVCSKPAITYRFYGEWRSSPRGTTLNASGLLDDCGLQMLIWRKEQARG